MATARDLIQASLRVLGVLPSGESPNANEAEEALAALQIMLRRWASNSLDVFAIQQDSISLSANKGEYSYGSGGDIDSSRPSKIVGAFIRDTNNNDYAVDIIDSAAYREIVAKSVPSTIPTALYYKPSYPLGVIYLYPVPSDSSYSLYIDALKPFTEITDLSDELQFPPEYQAAIKWNLAIELAPEYGKRLAPEVIALAQESLTSLERLNSLNNWQFVSPCISNGRVYNIYIDE